MGAFKRPHTGFECCAIRDRAAAWRTSEDDAATTVMSVHVHNVTARAMKRVSEAAPVHPSKSAIDQYHVCSDEKSKKVG